MERLVKTGYVKMIAIDVSDLESKIVDERNTNFLCDIEKFQQKYSATSTTRCVYIHMDDNFEISFLDYKKVIPHIHPFDYRGNPTIHFHIPQSLLQASRHLGSYNFSLVQGFLVLF